MSHIVRSHRAGTLPVSLVVPVLILALSASALLTQTGRAEDATPTPAPSITTEVLGEGMPSDAPGKVLWSLRITFAPGAVAPSHSHPGSTVFTIVSGSITFTLEEGSVTVNRAGTIATPMAAAAMAAPSEFTPNAGDSVYYEGDAVFTEVNEGSEPAVILASNLRNEGEPARMSHGG